jgi:ribosomal protein S27AE
MAGRFPSSEDWHSSTHHLECPRCGHHSIVAHGEGRYVCLRCNWQRNVGTDSEGMPPLVIIAIFVIIFLLFTGI